MRVRFWGTRGSLATPGDETVRYGGNTSCVEVRIDERSALVLDAGTGIRPLGLVLDGTVERVDVMLSHLHMDHIQGLGFFAPLFRADLEVHVWGPASPTHDLRARLSRYLSPPLFPVRLRDLPCRLELHDVPLHPFEVDDAEIRAAFVCHPGPTVGYRIEDRRGRRLAYLSDHEPALGALAFPDAPAWTSGYDLAQGADVLIHDTQYTESEYAERIGWGHSTLAHSCSFAELVDTRRLVAFHYDPEHDDDALDRQLAAGPGLLPARIGFEASREGLELEVG